MNVKFTCPSCNKQLALDERWAGHRVQCPHCNWVFTMNVAPKVVFPTHAEVDEPESNDKGQSERSEEACDAGMKDCPMCGERIKIGARKCRFCGEYLDREASHTIYSGPNGERLLSRSTYNGEMPYQMPRENHDTLCFWLGLLLGLSLIGILIAYLVGGKSGVVAALKGCLCGLLIYVAIVVVLGGVAAAL